MKRVILYNNQYLKHVPMFILQITNMEEVKGEVIHKTKYISLTKKYIQKVATVCIMLRVLSEKLFYITSIVLNIFSIKDLCKEGVFLMYTHMKQLYFLIYVSHYCILCICVCML